MRATAQVGLALAFSLLSAGAASGQVVGCLTGVDPRSGDTIRVGPWLSDRFARVQVDSAFAGIRTTDDQRSRATRIVQAAMTDIDGLRQFGSLPFQSAGDSTRAWARRIMDKRNAALAGLFSSDRDRNRLESNLETMSRSASRCDEA